MSEKISRRNFLKLTGLGAAAATVLTGCGPEARYVTRQAYFNMPEYSAVGQSTYYATTCLECPAGCGLVMRTLEGHALKPEGNPNHPVSMGKICSRGLVGVQGLYNPDRLKNPIRRSGENNDKITWDDALGLVNTALSNPKGVAFYLGLTSDHLYDLAVELTAKIGAPAPVRYGALGMFDGRAALAAAAKQVFGVDGFPYFDIGASDLVVSFGANFLETWVSPLAYSRGFGKHRRSFEANKKRGFFVAIEPRRSMTAGSADQWLAINPGSEGLVALALAKLLKDRYGVEPLDTSAVDVAAAAKSADVTVEALNALADRIVAAERPVFIPGGNAISHANGLATAVQILALNVAVGSFARPGGVFLAPAAAEATTLKPVQDLIARMNAGQVETLFVHGTNPAFELPPSLGFTAALKSVKQVISFAPFMDETAMLSHYVLPDHTPLESWGYQRTLAGSDRKIVSGVQPVVVPLYDTRATADVLLSSGKLAYTDVVDFIQQKIRPLLDDKSGTLEAQEMATFWSKFLQNGGWWQKNSTLAEAAPAKLPKEASALPEPPGNTPDQFHLLIYPTQLGDGSGANRPWLQETPNADTTVMWNSWIEINPETAKRLGIKDDDVVNVKSAAGEIDVVAYLYPAIRPDTVAIPFGQGHTALGRWAEGRGVNPIILVPAAVGDSGDLAYGDTFVTIKPTGRRRPISRVEDRGGVYGE
jgi:anaerobic selenocysteine-containing dehydrogenase